LDEEPGLEPEPEPEPEPELESDLIAELDEPAIQEDEAVDDTEDFLKPESDVTVLDFDEDEDGRVDQEDIDSLLQESDDEEEDEEDDDILISQDDIDTLLMAADQEDEDVLGDLMDEDSDDLMGDEDFDEDIDEDILESESSDEDEGEDEDDYEYDDDQVVLEGDGEDQAVKPEKKKIKTKSQWYKSKLVIACASALIVMGITIPLTYFVFIKGDSSQQGVQEPIARPVVEVGREIEIETVDINVTKQPDISRPGNMVLKDFIILASDLSKDMAYITADLSIDYSDQKAYHEIQDNLSFYRDLIYDSINKSIASGKMDYITEEDILGEVEASLKKVLPGHYIARISFKSFKAS